MKCTKCGTELEQGQLFCPKCGNEVQIVPDYNLMEDDIAEILSRNEKQKLNEPKTPKPVPDDNEPTKENKPKSHKKLYIGIGAAGAIIVVMAVLMFLSWHQKNTSFDYQYQIAGDYMKNGMYDKALESVKKALSIDKDSEEANLLLAKLYIQEKQDSDAVNTLLEVIQRNPDSEEAYSMLLSVYEGHGDYDSITKLCETVTNDEILALFGSYIVLPPVFSPEAGEYDNFITVVLSVSEDAQCFYTTDGSDPMKNGKVYTDEIKLPEGITTIRAVAMNDYNIFSDEVEATYNIKLEVPSKPQTSLASGTYTEKQMIAIEVPEGCTAYYTWDGTTPTANSTKYTGEFEMPEGNHVLSIILINENNLASDVARYNYIYNPPVESEENNGGETTEE